ncbi:MAG: hypothetical protein ACTSRS_14700 [Candidatus Helarchaeota archaeon]
MTIESQNINPTISDSPFISEISQQFIIPRMDISDCCASPNIVEHRGQFVCTHCAAVIGPVMKAQIHFNSNGSQILKRELKTPLQFYGSRTVFSLENLSSKRKALFQRLLKLNSHFHNAYEYNMTISNSIFYKYASQLEIPASIIQEGMRIYIKVVKQRLTIGRSIKQLSIASLYLACQLNNFNRDIENFSRISNIPIKAIRKNYRLILKTLGLKLKLNTASKYLAEFAIKLKLSFRLQQVAHRILDSLSNLHFNLNSSPKGFAGAALYVTAKKILPERKINQRQISEIAHVSEVTLRKYIKLIKENLDLNEFK